MIPDFVGRHCTLAPMRLDEAPTLAAWIEPRPPAEAATARAAVLKRWPSVYFDDAYPQKGRAFRIVAQGKAFGAAIHGAVEGAPRGCRIDLLLAPGTPREVATEAVKLLLRYVFETLHLQRVWADIPSGAAELQAAFEGAGFAPTPGPEGMVRWELLRASGAKPPNTKEK
jgi:hypothetical protein